MFPHQNRHKSMTITSKNQNTTTEFPNTAPTITTAETPNLIWPGGGRGAAWRPACAACKYQRRRCVPHCPLAPYFPAHKSKDFFNVHKLFGIRNVVKLLKKLPQHERQNAMKSVIFEANLRAVNPVGGCHSLIHDLQKKINLSMSELDNVRKQLAFCKEQLLPNFNVYDQMQGGTWPIIGVESASVREGLTARSANQERVKIEMVKNFSKNQAHEESCSQVTDSWNQETVKIETVQQFLNDKPTLTEEWRESNESRGNEELKDDDSKKPDGMLPWTS